MSGKQVVSVRLEPRTLAVLKLISEVTHDAPEADGADSVSELARNVLTNFAEHYVEQYGDDKEELLERLDQAIQIRREQAVAELEQIRALIATDDSNRSSLGSSRPSRSGLQSAGVP